jgi:hypothetical protein
MKPISTRPTPICSIKTTAELRLVLAAALLAAGVSAAAIEAPPPPGGRVAEYELSQRLILKRGIFEPSAALTERWQYSEQRPFRSLTLGSYGRAHKNLKVGAFYRLQYGARHDDDWIEDARKAWTWRDTGGRVEHVLMLDATPRMELAKNLVGSLKVRLERNTTVDQTLMIVSPELAWFWMDGLEPRATVSLRQETDFALDFGNRPLWQKWWYLAALWHFGPRVSAGPSLALRDEVWSTSEDYKRSGPGQSYTTEFQSWAAGLELVIRL